MTSRRELELVDEVQARAANRGSRPMPGFGQSAFLIVIRTYVVVLPNPWDLRQSPADTSPTRNCGLSLFFTRLSLQPLQVCASHCQRSPFRVDGEARHPRDVLLRLFPLANHNRTQGRSVNADAVWAGIPFRGFSDVTTEYRIGKNQACKTY